MRKASLVYSPKDKFAVLVFLSESPRLPESRFREIQGPLEMVEGERTRAAEFSGAQLDAIAGVVQRIVDKVFSERSGGVAAGGSEGGSAGAGRASAEGTTTAKTGESELKQ